MERISPLVFVAKNIKDIKATLVIQFYAKTCSVVYILSERHGVLINKHDSPVTL